MTRRRRLVRAGVVVALAIAASLGSLRLARREHVGSNLGPPRGDHAVPEGGIAAFRADASRALAARARDVGGDDGIALAREALTVAVTPESMGVLADLLGARRPPPPPVEGATAVVW